MGRPGKVKVDYFPHVTHTGKTIAILEARWGNDGYSFWFKLLELLGDTDGFCYNCNSASDWEYLLSRTGVPEAVAADILDKLAEIEAIDAGLWREKRVWSENFVAGVAPAFEKRKGELPRRPDFHEPNPEFHRVSDAGNVPENLPELVSGGFAGPETGRGEEKNGEDSNEKESGPEERVPCRSALRDGAAQQADTVYLKPAEVERLRQEHGSDGADRIIALLDAYKTNHPKKCGEYRDDYKVIRTWVISRYLEERASPPLSAGRPRTFIDRLADMARGEAI